MRISMGMNRKVGGTKGDAGLRFRGRRKCTFLGLSPQYSMPKMDGWASIGRNERI